MSLLIFAVIHPPMPLHRPVYTFLWKKTRGATNNRQQFIDIFS